MPSVNSNIIVWARKTAGLTIAGAASKMNLKEVRLEKIERGEENPTQSILMKMAKTYRRPAVIFYLEDIPAEANYGADFRGNITEFTDIDQAQINALVRYAKSSQQLIRDTLELEEATPLSFVGWLRRKWGLPEETTTMNHRLQSMPSSEYAGLIQDAIDGIDLILDPNCTPEMYYRQKNKREAFKLIRSSCEQSGIFVILKNDLGSHHTKLSSELFRAFVIADNIAPLMIINRSDPHPDMSFSILHEIVHLLLDQTGISNFERTTPMEKFCNQVAGSWLLPLELIEEEWEGEESRMLEVISRISSQRNLSRMMVATRLYQEKFIQKEVYSQLMNQYRDAWKTAEQERNNSPNGFANYYVTQRNHLGNRTIEFANQMIESGGLTVTEAALILGAKPSNVFKLIRSE